MELKCTNPLKRRVRRQRGETERLKFFGGEFGRMAKALLRNPGGFGGGSQVVGFWKYVLGADACGTERLKYIILMLVRE